MVRQDEKYHDLDLIYANDRRWIRPQEVRMSEPPESADLTRIARIGKSAVRALSIMACVTFAGKPKAIDTKEREP